MPTPILFLDDDHVLRLARYALAGPGEVSEAWVRAYFSPEEIDPALVFAAGRGLHAADGVGVLPMAAAADAKSGAEAAILIFRRGTITAELLARYPKAKFVQRLGARADMIDFKATSARQIAVSCLPRRTLIYTAEHAILLMLALAKRLLEADDAVRRNIWDRARVTPIDAIAYNWAGLDRLSGLYGKTLGIIGLGEVGAILAERARAFGMTVVYANRRQLPAEQERRLAVSYVPLMRLLPESDFVSLNAANLPENRGLMGAAAFAAMKPTAFFVNTSRGKLVDERALHAALTAGKIAGAALDVHWEEPRPQPDPLAGLKNVILTPHCAAGSRGGSFAEVEELFDNCRAMLAGKTPRHLMSSGST